MLFSIIVPIYNCEKHIRNCIDSILNQTINDYEVIFVNNNSTDNSIEIIRQSIDSDNTKFKLINCDEQGAGPSRNAGIKSSSGDYIITIDADDTIDPMLLSNLLEIIEHNDNIDLIKFNAHQIKSNGEILNKDMFFTNNIGIMNGEQAVNYCCNEFLAKGVISGPSWLYAIKREYLMKHNLLFTNMLQEDFGLFIYLLLYADRIYFSDFVGYYYIFRDLSITNNPINQMKKAKDLIRHCVNYRNNLLQNEKISIETKKCISSFIRKTLHDKYIKLSNNYKKEFLNTIYMEELDVIYNNTSI